MRIEANVDANSGWVELKPPLARIAEGGTATWIFTGVPDGLRPALLFEDVNPFGHLSWRDGEIQGSAFRGLEGECMYKVCLLGAGGDDPLVRRLQCRDVPAGGLVRDPGPRSQKT